MKHTCVEPASKGVNIMLSKLAYLLNGRLDGSRSPHSTVCPSTYVRRPPSINVDIQYSLTVWFDHTFFQTIFGDHFLPFAQSPRFSQLVKPSSLGASLGGKLCRIMVKPYLAGRSPSSGWAVSPPQGSQHSSTTNIDPCNGCLLGRS